MFSHTSLTNRSMVAGAFLAFATMSSMAEVVISDQGHRFFVKDNAAQLLYQSCDSTNSESYKGVLEVPAEIPVDEGIVPVTGVSPYACVYCDSLTAVVLPEGISRIGFAAFSDCPSLSEVSLPQSLESLGDWAFYHDSSLVEVRLPAATRRVGACAFGFCTSLTEVELQPRLRSIAHNAFYQCTSLQSVEIPWSVDQIGEYAFAYCTALDSITLYDAPIAITPDVFEGVDVSKCRLVVPTDQVEAYAEADVWRDFIIIDGGYVELPMVPEDASWNNGFSYRVSGTTIYINVSGDAPALVYDLMGRRIAVAASGSGENVIPLTRAHYIIRCGKQSVKLSL